MRGPVAGHLKAAIIGAVHSLKKERPGAKKSLHLVSVFDKIPSSTDPRRQRPGSYTTRTRYHEGFMTEQQWRQLLAVLQGEQLDPPPIAFIIDSPWLPGWRGISTLAYYTSGEQWFQANLDAITTFPEATFLPGFWAEFGMCTEPSAFGSRLIWAEHNLPHADKVLRSTDEIADLVQPDVTSDGLLPFVIELLRQNQPRIQSSGHEIRFAVCRGPLNIASFLMGTTEFLILLATDPERTQLLLEKITDFSVSWLAFQKQCFPTIDGILVLDDIVGFIGDEDCRTFAVPHLKKIFAAFDATVRFFHNDAKGLVCAPYLQEMGVNLFNFSHEHSLPEMRKKTGPAVTLLGNIPPRDVMALGTAEDVRRAVRQAWASIPDRRRIVWSCGGGMPQGVPMENIRAFIDALLTLE